jgi:hypothetical protein
MYPISNRPKITQQDIARGYVSRYFVKYLNSKKIVEVDKQQYFKFVTNTSYQTIEIKWIIGGYDNDTLVNRDQILYGAETQNKNQKEIYNQIMPGVARMLPNPLEYFSGKRIQQFTEKTLEIPETNISTFGLAEPAPEPPITILSWQTIAEDSPFLNGTYTVNLSGSGYLISNPQSSGWSSYEYNDTADTWTVMDYDAIKVSKSTINVARSNVNFDHTSIRLISDINRLAVDTAGDGGIAAFIPDTPISSYNGTDYLRGVVTRVSAASMSLDIKFVSSSGLTTTLATSQNILLPVSSGKRVMLQVLENTASLYYGDYGADPSTLVLACSSSLPTQLQGITSRRIGYYSGWSLATSGGTIFNKLIVQNYTSQSFTSLTRSTTGKLAAFQATADGFVSTTFNPADWAVPTNTRILTSSNNLLFTSSISNTNGFSRYLPSGELRNMFVQTVWANKSTGGAGGAATRINAASSPSQSVYYYIPSGFSGTEGLYEQNSAGTVLQSSSQESVNRTLPQRVSVYVNESTAISYMYDAAVSRSLSGVTVFNGSAGVYYSSGTGNTLTYSEFFLMTDRYITFNNVPTGWVIQLKNESSGSISAQVSSSGTTQQIDTLTLRYPIKSIRILSASTIVASAAPDTAVWGGDVWTYTE